MMSEENRSRPDVVSNDTSSLSPIARRVKNLQDNVNRLVDKGLVTASDWIHWAGDKNSFYNDVRAIVRDVDKMEWLFSFLSIPFPSLKHSTDGSRSGELSFSVRPFAAEMLSYSDKREEVVARVVQHEQLMPDRDDSIYIGNGTTMLLLAKHLAKRLEITKFSLSTDSIEILANLYYSCNRDVMSTSIAFMGREIDWREGTLRHPGNEPTERVFRTVYLSAATLTVKGAFWTRDRASHKQIQEALNSSALRQVVFVLDSSKITGRIKGDADTRIDLDHCLTSPIVSVFLVTDRALDQELIAILSDSGVFVVSPNTTEEEIENEQAKFHRSHARHGSMKKIKRVIEQDAPVNRDVFPE